MAIRNDSYVGPIHVPALIVDSASYATFAEQAGNSTIYNNENLIPELYSTLNKRPKLYVKSGSYDYLSGSDGGHAVDIRTADAPNRTGCLFLCSDLNDYPLTLYTSESSVSCMFSTYISTSNNYTSSFIVEFENGLKYSSSLSNKTAQHSFTRISGSIDISTTDTKYKKFRVGIQFINTIAVTMQSQSYDNNMFEILQDGQTTPSVFSFIRNTSDEIIKINNNNNRPVLNSNAYTSGAINGIIPFNSISYASVSNSSYQSYPKLRILGNVNNITLENDIYGGIYNNYNSFAYLEKNGTKFQLADGTTFNTNVILSSSQPHIKIQANNTDDRLIEGYESANPKFFSINSKGFYINNGNNIAIFSNESGAALVNNKYHKFLMNSSSSKTAWYSGNTQDELTGKKIIIDPSDTSEYAFGIINDTTKYFQIEKDGKLTMFSGSANSQSFYINPHAISGSTLLQIGYPNSSSYDSTLEIKLLGASGKNPTITFFTGNNFTTISMQFGSFEFSPGFYTNGISINKTDVPDWKTTKVTYQNGDFALYSASKNLGGFFPASTNVLYFTERDSGGIIFKINNTSSVENGGITFCSGANEIALFRTFNVKQSNLPVFRLRKTGLTSTTRSEFFEVYSDGMVNFASGTNTAASTRLMSFNTESDTSKYRIFINPDASATGKLFTLDRSGSSIWYTSSTQKIGINPNVNESKSLWIRSGSAGTQDAFIVHSDGIVVSRAHIAATNTDRMIFNFPQITMMGDNKPQSATGSYWGFNTTISLGSTANSDYYVAKFSWVPRHGERYLNFQFIIRDYRAAVGTPEGTGSILFQDNISTYPLYEKRVKTMGGGSDNFYVTYSIDMSGAYEQNKPYYGYIFMRSQITGSSTDSSYMAIQDGFVSAAPYSSGAIDYFTTSSLLFTRGNYTNLGML